MASKKTKSKSSRKPVTVDVKESPTEAPKEVKDGVTTVRNLSQPEIKKLIAERWGNNGNVEVTTAVSLSNKKVMDTLDVLLTSPEQENYVPEKPGDAFEWAIVGINNVQFKVRRNIDVVLPKQVHEKLRIGVKKRIQPDIERLDLNNEENESKAEILNHFG